MKSGVRIILRWSLVLLVILVAAALIGLRYLRRVPSAAGPIPAERQDLVVLAFNDLGMHCIQPDYSVFFILPPANNLVVQVFDRKHEGKAITKGIIVEYRVKDNTYSAGKTNFWTYAKSYGYSLPTDVGIAGFGLSGRMSPDPSGRYFVATGIPLTPYKDRPTIVSPYQLGVVTVRDEKSGSVLALLDNVVLPVSDEMNCGGCHGHSETGKTILAAHDRRVGTSLGKDLLLGIRHRCNECHADPILDAEGKPGVSPLSQAIHWSHAERVKSSRLEPVCYNCHPGVVTRCNRGVMFKQEIICDDPRCHGPMSRVAASQRHGRRAWLDEPDCAGRGCHAARYGTNPGILYRQSYLQNAPNPGMDNMIACGSCHNGAHAEWPSTGRHDNDLPRQVLGYSSFIDRCPVCHAQGRVGRMHSGAGMAGSTVGRRIGFFQ